MIEGELRCKELSAYLEKLGTEKIVWLAEDVTAIDPTVNYDVVSDTLVGLVTPFDKRTGCPPPYHYRAATANEITEHMKNDMAQSIYVVMAQPLNEDYPPFVLQLYGWNNSMTSRDVTKRWYYVEKELKKHGIEVAGYSGDGDARILSSMCKNLFVDSGFLTVQDSIHIATKLRNRLLNVDHLPMGTGKVSVNYLKRLVLNVDKSIHGLCLTDVSPVDRQNFDSFERVTADRVINSLLTHIENSEATVKYLELCRYVVSSYREFDLKPLDRVERMFKAVYFFRIWRENIRESNRYKLKENFITSNAFCCIELNARNLLLLIRKFRNKPQHFITTLFQSQICEKFFRQLRATGTMNFTKINFSVLEVLYMIGRIEVQNEILYFKLNTHPDIIIPKFQKEKTKTKIYPLPTEEEISGALNRARIHALKEAEKFGMSMNETVLENYQFPSKINAARVTETETDYETDDEAYEAMDCEYLPFGSRLNTEFAHEFNEVEEIVESENKKRSFVEVVCDNGTIITMKKSTLVWNLLQKGVKTSNLRLKRVRTMTYRSPSKRLRRQSVN